MVLIHAKGLEENQQFVFETNVQILMKNLKEELVKLHNLQNKILKLTDAASELAKHGHLRPEELRGMSDEELKLSKGGDKNFKNAPNPDTYNFRTGIPPPEECSKHLKEACEDVKNQLSVENAEKGVTITLEKLNIFLKRITDALSNCYPTWDDLPPYDTTRMILEQEGFLKENLICEETCIWWAGKIMTEEKYLKDFIGRNEKTKLKIKLQRTKDGPPVREPRIDQETYKAMLAYYHKKSKEEKEMEEDDDDSYLDSEWANPLNLQKQLHGNLSDIKWKP